MKIAFWNLGGMSSPSDKLKVCSDWIKAHAPDLLVFEEISSRMSGTRQLGALHRVLWISTLDVNGNHGTKDIAVFAVDTLKLVADRIELPFFQAVKAEREGKNLVVNDPRREVAEVQIQLGHHQYLHVYGLHANSSYSGGNTALRAMDMFIAHNALKFPIIAGGDFNTSKGDVSTGLVTKVPPIGHDGAELAFTQWVKDDRPARFSAAHLDFDKAAFQRYCSHIRLKPETIAGWTKCVVPHDQIDFLLHTAGLKIKALPNCTGEEEWLAVLREFDHCPVLYDVQT